MTAPTVISQETNPDLYQKLKRSLVEARGPDWRAGYQAGLNDEPYPVAFIVSLAFRRGWNEGASIRRAMLEPNAPTSGVAS